MCANQSDPFVHFHILFHSIGITPFPYKVAKSLDQNIYRNVELDSWNEQRKISKQKQHYKVSRIQCIMRDYFFLVDKRHECHSECDRYEPVHI